MLAIEEGRQAARHSSGPSRKHTSVSVEPSTACSGFVSADDREIALRPSRRCKFSGISQQRRDDAGTEILRLVDHDVKWTPVARVRVHAP